METLKLISDFKYTFNLHQYKRIATRKVNIGDIPMGSNNPIRIQSMTTTDTMNTKTSVEQIIRMVHSGCEYVRLTAPSIKEAENLREIKKELKKQGIKVPLIADIHFTPNAAELAASIVEKVRINPGNYADKKRFEHHEYTLSEYQEELDRIRKRFLPLVKICKEHGTAMRIGTNHGSLSDRILSRYGDTPLGMVESAMEFIRICEDENYFELVLSMKASNPQVMVQAYRLLVNRLWQEGMNYPLHLGVTEAGGGEDGRIKSAIGIGSLLEDGIGDTIRVSLTEDPEFEAPVAMAIVDHLKKRPSHTNLKPVLFIDDNDIEIKEKNFIAYPLNPYEYKKREAIETINFGGNNVPRVIMDFSNKKPIPADLLNVGHTYLEVLDKWNMSDQGCDYVYLGDNLVDFMFPNGLKGIYNYSTWLKSNDQINFFPYCTVDQIGDGIEKARAVFIEFTCSQSVDTIFSKISGLKKVILVLNSSNIIPLMEFRQIVFELMNKGINHPVIFRKKIILSSQISKTVNGENNKWEVDKYQNFQIETAIELGSLFIDGLGDGLWLDNCGKNPTADDIKLSNYTSFCILQAVRARIFKTEYISCPSCGRTLFDLQETTEKIRKRTEHLKGVKIGIMGCIVNGPGEMADADYGYVGVGPGKIALYRGKTIVQRSVNAEDAVDELIRLIQEDGNWIERV